MDVLVAHRDPAFRERVEAILERSGYMVGAVDAPAQAPAACRVHDPDVVLLEAEGGLEALDAIKRDADEFTVAVVLVGSADDVADPATLIDRGAHDVLVEPVQDAEVVLRCASATKVRHLQEAVLDVGPTVEAVSRVDALTGFFNRGFVFEQFNALTNVASRHRRPLSVMAVDIDQIAEIDERLGRAAGDEVVQRVAECLRARLREEDMAGRLARGDFLVLLPETGGEAAACVAESLRATVADTGIEIDEQCERVTISVGWAQMDADHPERFLEDVDSALDRARHAGRNRVCGPPSS